MQTVEAIYQLLLSRSVDPAGKATWTQVIEAGEYSRCKQINFIALSDEFLISFDSISRLERLRRTLVYAQFAENGKCHAHAAK